MITSAAVFSGVRALWTSSAELTRLVPGGLWEGPPKTEVEPPYARAAVAPGEITRTSGTALYEFTLTLSVWSDVGREDAGDIETAMFATFRQGRAPLLNVAGAATVHLMQIAGEVDEAGAHEGKEVKLTAGKWQILLEGPQ